VAGASQAYTVDARDQYGNSRGDVTATTTFTIAPDGSCAGASCTATAAGAHSVTASTSGKTATAALTVTPGPLDSVAVAPASASITAGQSQSYTVTGLDQYRNSRGDMTASTTFTIGPDGSCSGAVCTATAAGAHTVTATSGGKTATASLAVGPAGLDTIVIAPASASIVPGGSQAYTAEARDQYGNSRGDVTAGTTFTIEPDGSCTGASCGASAVGEHTVTASFGGKTATAGLTITTSAAAVDRIVMTPPTATVAAGESQTYSVEGYDSYENSLGDVTALTTFTVAPDGTCVSASCAATAAGEHTVTANYGGETATAHLTVTPAPLDHLVVTPGSASIVAGEAQPYTVEARDQYGNSRGDVTASTTFTMAPDGSCAETSCSATVAGSHTVTASSSGKTATAELMVTPAPLDHLVVTPGTASIAAGGSQAYFAEGRDQYGNSRGDVTSATTFTIAPDGSCAAAVCTATTAGAHTVTGTSEGKTGAAAFTVTPAPLDRIVIAPAAATIVAGGSQAYTAEARDRYGNSRGDVTAGTTFTIAPDGTCSGNACTAPSGGAYTVTGTHAGKTATAALNADFVRNPGFETGLTGWNTSGSGTGVTVARVVDPLSNSWVARMTNGSSVAAAATLQDTPNWVAATAAGTYTGVFWARADVAGAKAKIKFREYDGSTAAGSVVVDATLGTSWQKLTMTYAVTVPGTTLDFQITVPSAAPGSVFYVDDASILYAP